jgi:hypothetical protein
LVTAAYAANHRTLLLLHHDCQEAKATETDESGASAGSKLKNNGKRPSTSSSGNNIKRQRADPDSSGGSKPSSNLNPVTTRGKGRRSASTAPATAPSAAGPSVSGEDSADDFEHQPDISSFGQFVSNKSTKLNTSASVPQQQLGGGSITASSAAGTAARENTGVELSGSSSGFSPRLDNAGVINFVQTSIQDKTITPKAAVAAAAERDKVVAVQALQHQINQLTAEKAALNDAAAAQTDRVLEADEDLQAAQAAVQTIARQVSAVKTELAAAKTELAAAKADTQKALINVETLRLLGDRMSAVHADLKQALPKVSTMYSLGAVILYT